MRACHGNTGSLLRRLDHPADLTRRAGIVSAKQQATLASKASLVYTLATDCEAKAPSEAIGVAVAAWLVTKDRLAKEAAALAGPTVKSRARSVFASESCQKSNYEVDIHAKSKQETLSVRWDEPRNRKHVTAACCDCNENKAAVRAGGDKDELKDKNPDVTADADLVRAVVTARYMANSCQVNETQAGILRSRSRPERDVMTLNRPVAEMEITVKVSCVTETNAKDEIRGNLLSHRCVPATASPTTRPRRPMTKMRQLLPTTRSPVGNSVLAGKYDDRSHAQEERGNSVLLIIIGPACSICIYEYLYHANKMIIIPTVCKNA